MVMRRRRSFTVTVLHIENYGDSFNEETGHEGYLYLFRSSVTAMHS